LHPPTVPLRLSAALAVAAALVCAPGAGAAPSGQAHSVECADVASARDASLRARAAYVPNDSGVATTAGPVGGWAAVQWELNGPFGINSPAAWSQASRLGGSGGRGVTVAVLDSGVAYANRGPYKRSPDLARSRFVRGYDFVDDDAYPNDAYGHGTFVASTIAATANNTYGTVGVAYRSQIMPLRVLDYEGRGCPPTIARAIHFAVSHGTDIINLSLELFDGPRLHPVARSVSASPSIRAALEAARGAGVIVVSAAGNSFDRRVPGARHDTLAINVGGTTEHGCLGSYSNHGPGMDLVAPGGGEDAPLTSDPNCQPEGSPGRDVSGVSFHADTPNRFEILPRFRGTSTAAPHVAGVAALVLASGVLGTEPSPAQVERHLKKTARDLGVPGPDGHYSVGLVDAAAAIAPPG